MQIRTRLAVQFFFISAAMLLLALGAIYFISEKFQKNEFFSRLEARANTTADLLIRVDQVDSTLLKLIDLNRKDVLEYENISVYDSKKNEIYTNNDTINFAEILPSLDLFLDEVLEVGKKKTSIGDVDVIGVQYFHREDKFIVIACARDIYGINNLSQLFVVLVIVFLTFLIIIGVAARIYSSRALNPISKLVSEVNDITPNSLNVRIEVINDRDEIGQLTKTFNRLLDRIEHGFVTQKLFVSNASHELRNPLTAITSQLEVTLLQTRTTKEYEEVLNSVLEDISRLNDMSHRLLQLSKIDTESVEFSSLPVRLDDLLWETKNEFLAKNPGCMINLELHNLPENEEQLTIPGNSQLLKTCFWNLIDNACKFSPDHSVLIEMYVNKNEILIQFSDNGVGIDEAELPFIFEPYYRGKNAAKIGGYGIGLSLVEKILRTSNGQIRIESKLNAGTKVFLSFPHS